MKILVTGGAGAIGKVTTERFVRKGWDVRVIGLESGVEIPGAEVVTCDIMNYDDVRKQMRGCDAVVHLAALRGPQLAPGHKIFEINVAGTFNVFEAAAAEGIRRVVQASSINAFGCAYSITDISPRYFPIDEEHPSFTNDPYSFSKETVEEIGRYYWRREGISGVAMRFPWVYPEEVLKREDFRRSQDIGRKAIDALAALPETDRQARLAEVKQRALEYRKQRPLEFKEVIPKTPTRANTEDKLWHAYTFDRFNFWASIDVRDAAQSLEKAITASYDGAHPLYVNDPHNLLGYDSRSLVRFFFPEVSDSNIALSGSSSLVSINKARALIGFEPEHSVENLYKS